MPANTESQSLIAVTIHSGIAVVLLNRPDARNAMDDKMRTEFIVALERLADDDNVKGVVVTGSGQGFCSGGDVAGMGQRLTVPVDQIALRGWRRQKRTHQGIASIHGIGKPTIAAVNGAAVGLGCDLALACDFILVSESGWFAMSFIHRGLVPDGGGLYFLPRRIGLPRAKELIFTGRRVDAQEALAIGLADRIAKPNKLLKIAIAWARDLSSGSSPAMALTKAILDRSLESSEETVAALGRQAQAICYTTSEHKVAVADFLAKNKR